MLFVEELEKMKYTVDKNQPCTYIHVLYFVIVIMNIHDDFN